MVVIATIYLVENNTVCVFGVGIHLSVQDRSFTSQKTGLAIPSEKVWDVGIVCDAGMVCMVAFLPAVDSMQDTC